MKKFPHTHPLLISLDSAILNKKYGNALERQIEYATHLGGLTIIVLNTVTSRKNNLLPYSHDNLTIIPTNSPNRWHTILDGYRIALKQVQLSNQKPINVLSAQDPFITGLIGVMLKKKLQLPLNIQMHAADFVSTHWRVHSVQNRILFWLGKWVLKQADSVRYGSDQLLECLKVSLPFLTQNTYKAPVYVDATYFENNVKLKSNIKNIVTVGRLAWEKNHSNLLAAFAQIKSKYPQLTLTIVGGGIERNKLDSQIVKLRLENCVSISGSASKKQVRQQLLRADLFVFPSYYEGWGMAVVEAVAAGVPVVMTNTGCANELIINKKSGSIIDNTSSKSIASSILEAIINPAKTYAQAKNAQLLLKKTFTKDRLIEEWLRCLHETTQIKS